MKIKKSLKKLIYKNFSEYNNKIALVFQNKKITYSELLQKSEQLATSLLSKKYDKIAISMEDKLNTIIIVLACIFSEIPFIIIDKNSPYSFLENILSEANIKFVITDYKIKIDNIEFLEFDKLFNNYKINSHFINEEIQNNVLFFIATSGSTGKPKIAKRFLSVFLQDYLELEKDFSFLFNMVAQQYAKLNFSYGLENTLLLLIGGTTICFGDTNTGTKDIEKMYSEIVRNNATVVFWASPIIKLLSKHYKLCNNMPNSIKYIYTGGEPLVISADLVVEFHNRNIILINDYGCSEIGKIFTYPFSMKLRNIQTFNIVGVGKPLKGYEALILDENFNEVTEGYLYLKSKNKFLCSYVNENIKTNEIIKNGYYFYNTQDIAKIENGKIIILGRENNSVNVYGYRVELEQIEYYINQINEVVVCVVIPFYNQYHEVTLYCFYKGEIDSFELRKKLKKFIPDYMIPLAFFLVRDIYLLPNGKVDRKRNIEKFKNFIEKKDFDGNNLKERIYKYLMNIIGVKIGNLNEIYLKPFFEYGVDSLLVVDFISTVEEKENIKLSIESTALQIKCLKDIVDLITDYKKG